MITPSLDQSFEISLHTKQGIFVKLFNKLNNVLAILMFFNV